MFRRAELYKIEAKLKDEIYSKHNTVCDWVQVQSMRIGELQGQIDALYKHLGIKKEWNSGGYWKTTSLRKTRTSRNDVLRSLEGFMAEKQARIEAGCFPEQSQDDLNDLEKIYEWVEQQDDV